MRRVTASRTELPHFTCSGEARYVSVVLVAEKAQRATHTAASFAIHFVVCWHLRPRFSCVLEACFGVLSKSFGVVSDSFGQFRTRFLSFGFWGHWNVVIVLYV